MINRKCLFQVYVIKHKKLAKLTWHRLSFAVLPPKTKQQNYHFLIEFDKPFTRNWNFTFSDIHQPRMGLTISNVFNRLFGKKQMRILMGKFENIVHLEWLRNFSLESEILLIKTLAAVILSTHLYYRGYTILKTQEDHAMPMGKYRVVSPLLPVRPT